MRRISPNLNRGYGGPNSSNATCKKDQLNAGAWKRRGKNYKKAGQWYCHHCNQEVIPEHVTFDEKHDPRFGGCGNYL